MGRAVYNLSADITGEAYASLLQEALSACESFTLVVRHSMDLDDSERKVLNRLQPFLIAQEEKSEWPGTQLLDSTAQVNSYELTPLAAEVLAEAASGLFSWTQPELPEDLCLFRAGGEPWLVTTAHEEDGFMVLSAEEAKALTKEFPHCHGLGSRTPEQGYVSTSPLGRKRPTEQIGPARITT